MWGDAPWRCAQRLERTAASWQSTPDVAIVGAGLTGVSAAYHLARRGIRTVVFEAARIGDAASGRTGGIVLEGTARGIAKGADTCIASVQRVVRDERIQCDLRLPGCWEITHRDTGTPLPWDDAGERISIAGTVPGGTVNPLAMLVGVAQAAVRAGAIIRENVRVRRIDTAGATARLETEDGIIKPRFIVVAANAWTASIAPNVRSLRSALTFACATEPLDSSMLDELGLASGMPFYTIDLPYLWGRLTGDNRVIFGAGLTFGSPAELEALDVASGEPADVLNALETRVRGLNPVLQNVKFSARWGGPIAFANDFTPLLGALPQAPNVLVAGAYAGHGVALSVRAGELMAAAIADGAKLPEWGCVTV